MFSLHARIKLNFAPEIKKLFIASTATKNELQELKHQIKLKSKSLRTYISFLKLHVRQYNLYGR